MSFFTKLWNSISSRKLNAEIQQEIETHLALLEDEARTKGLNPHDAQMDVRQLFGNQGKHFENTRDTNLSDRLDDLAHDVRFAWRQMRRNRGFTSVAVLVIGLGIGSVTTIFSLVNAVLIRSLPYTDTERLVYLWTPNPLLGTTVPRELAPSSRTFMNGSGRTTRSPLSPWSIKEWSIWRMPMVSSESPAHLSRGTFLKPWVPSRR